MNSPGTPSSPLRQASVTSWQQLNDRYTPLIRAWLRQRGVPRQESDDLVQEVLAVVFRRLPEFNGRENEGAFVGWLHKITHNCVRNFRRAQRRYPAATGGSGFHRLMEQQPTEGETGPPRWEHEHQRHLMGRLMARIRPRFADQTWRAFERVAVQGRRPSEVAGELGITANAVSIAKSRVLALLRLERQRLETL